MATPYVSIVVLSREIPEKVIEDLKAQSFKDFEIVHAKEKGIVKAMNIALENAKGEIFVRIDDDVELPPYWLEELVKPFKDPEVGGVTGPTFIPKDRRANRDSIRMAENYNWFLKWLFDADKFRPAAITESGCVSYDSNFSERFDYRSGMGIWRSADHLEGTNWAMRIYLIRRVGGFDEAFDGVCEWFDDDVVFKAKKLGYKMVYNQDAFMFHMVEKGSHFGERFEGFGRIKNFLRFHWRHGRGRFLKLKFYIYLIVWMGYFLCKRLKFL